MHVRAIAIAIAVAGCSDDPHDVIDCGNAWVSILGAGSASCERACVPMPVMAGSGCSAAVDATTNNVGFCSATFVVAGAPSCCGLASITPRAVDIVLYTCQ